MAGTKKRGLEECWLRKVGGHSTSPIFDVANRELVTVAMRISAIHPSTMSFDVW